MSLEPSAVELGLCALYLQSSPDRSERVRKAAASVRQWDELRALLESHGVLPLVHLNLRRAGVELPTEVSAAWTARVRDLEQDGLRFRLTLETTLAALDSVGIRPTLLKGASLGLDLYPDGVVRGMGDLDLLVAPHEVPQAVEACSEKGLVMGSSSFPAWWYRLAHFHLKLRPASSLLREVELHWALHHPSLLLTVGSDDLRERSSPVLDGRAHTLGSEDRLLHLITHLASHAYGARSASREDLRNVLSEPDHPLRLKWLLDVHAEIERVHAELPPPRFRARVEEWNATGDVRWVLAWIEEALGFEQTARTWVHAVLGGRVRPLEGEATPGQVGPLTGFDFRAGALRRYPRWLWPPGSYLRRSQGSAGPITRLFQALRVLGQSLLAGASLPVAVLGKAVLAGRRNRAAERARGPEQVLDQAVALRALEGKRRAA